MNHHDNLEQPTLFEMTDIADQSKRGWSVSVNGTTQNNVSHAKLENAKMAVSVEYGQRPEGYDGIIIREPGGAATIPYMIHSETGAVYIGLVQEYRPTMGEAVTSNIPRGFMDVGEANKQSAAERELAEETGLREIGGRMVRLAAGLNPNSTFFDYSSSPEAGVDIFAIELRQDELVLKHDDDGNVFYTFPEHIQKSAEGDKAAERIMGSVFVPLETALQSRDMFTAAATGQLLAKRLREGDYIVPQNMSAAQK